MKYGSCTFFTYDDPPAPQEPPQHHTPLPPPRSRKGSSFNHRPSSSGSNNSMSTQSASPAQSPILHPYTHKTGTKSMDDSLPSTQNPKRPTNARSQSTITSNEGTIGTGPLVTKDKSGTTISISLPHVDDHTSFNASFKDTILAQIAALHVGASGVEWAPTQSDVGGKPLDGRKKPSNTTTTTTMEWTDSPNYSDPPFTDSAGPQTKFVMDRRRSEVETDGRSMISSLLDAYCRSDVDDLTEDEAELLWRTDDSSMSRTDGRDFEGSGPSSAPLVSSNVPQRRPKPASLVIASPFDWEETIGVGLPAVPQTAPATKHTRPLPPLPAPQRPIRPLPRPPQPPPYSSPVYSTPSPASSIPPVQSPSLTLQTSTTSSPPPNKTTSFISAISSSTSSFDASSTQSSTSKRPLLTPLLTVSACSSGTSSPLTPDMPFPPSPMTAKRHQASKLSKMLGEVIPPELVYGRPRHPPRNHISVTDARPVNNLNLAAKGPYTPPAPTFGDTQILATRQRARTDRPQPIYIPDNASEEFGDTDGEEDEESTSEYAEGGSNDSYTGIKVNIPVGENLEDQMYLSPADSRKACSVLESPTDSSLEDYELDDMEEAHIGWALQNVITYEVASRVKRTSRMWVLEKNGEKWEEEDYNNVRNALRQL